MSLSRFLDDLAAPAAETVIGGRLPDEASASCPEAWRFEISEDPRIATYCSRRAGKTESARRKAIRKLARVLPASRANHPTWVHVVSLIRRNAKKHWWNHIKLTLDKLGWSYKPWEQDMILRLSNGAFLQALGIDDTADVKKLQGDYSDLIMGDEAHLPNSDVQSAFYKAATPMLDDFGGQFAWLGLPPEVEGTEFDNAIVNPEWTKFNWNSLDHDYPESREVKRARIEKELKRRGLTWDSPEAKRIYLGKRVRDASLQAYEYQQGRNDYDPTAVEFERPGWSHSVGLDLGYQDRDAVVVLAWRPDDPERRVYARFIWQRNHLSTDSLDSVVKCVAAVYRPVVWTGDHGGHGAVKVLETLKERLHIQINLKPPDVLVSLGFVNDDLRTGRLLLPTVDVETARVEAAARARHGNRPSELAAVLGLLADSWTPPGAELARVPKLVNPRTMKLSINPKGPNHSDISEALRYAHAGARNWMGKAATPVRRLTLEEREEQAEMQELEDYAQDSRRTWYQRQARQVRG